MTFSRPITPEEGENPEEARLPFPGATGRGVRVAVIDSGVHVGHPHIGRVAGGISVGVDGAIEEHVYTDLLGHGTAVMAAIQEKAPAAEYFAVRVFQSSLSTSASCLLHAIEWCVDRKMDVVNLSLGSFNNAHRERFARAAARALKAGTLLAAAREANGQLCYPGSLPTVFSVGLDWECPRNSYRCEINGEDTVYYACGYPRPAPGVPPTRNLHGISFAVANMTSFIIRACEAERGRESGDPRERSIRAALLREHAAGAVRK